MCSPRFSSLIDFVLKQCDRDYKCVLVFVKHNSMWFHRAIRKIWEGILLEPFITSFINQ